jgi:CHAT domain-containing protein/Flp pilus assembly protein TadD
LHKAVRQTTHLAVCAQSLGKADDRNGQRKILAQLAMDAGNKLRLNWRYESFLKAIEKYEEALSHYRVAGDSQGVAVVLKSIGDVYAILGLNKKALDHYNQARESNKTSGNRKLEIDLLNALGAIKIEMGDYQIALEYCNRAKTSSLEMDYQGGEAQALNYIGLVSYDSTADLQKALDFFNGALAIWQMLNDNRGQAESLANIGYAYSDLGEIHKALSNFSQALELWQRVNDGRGQARMHAALGLQYTWMGELQKAINYQNKALRFFQIIGDGNGEAVACNGLGYVYDVLGDTRKSLDSYNNALRLYKASNNRVGESVAMGHLGRIYSSLGETRKALDCFTQKLVISRALGDLRTQAYTLKDLGVVSESSGNIQSALDFFARALAMSHAANDPRGQAQVLNCIGHLHYRLGKPEKALELHNQALNLIRKTIDRKEEVLTLHCIAQAERDLGNLAAANDHLKCLIKITESLRTNIAGQELRASYFASAHQHYELYIDVLMQRHKQDPSGHFDQQALEVSERARARGLLELMIETGINIREGVDPVLLERERMLQQLLNAKAARQFALLRGVHTAEQESSINQELEALTSEHEQVQAQIRTASPRYATLMQPLPLSLAEIQRQVMDPDTLLLEYSLGDKRSFLWAVTETSITSFDLPPRAEIDRAAKRLYELLSSPTGGTKREINPGRQRRIESTEAQCAEAIAHLSHLLVEPVAAHLGSKHLVIIADVSLQYVPFAALQVLEASPNGVHTNQPLMVNHQIINLPSASLMAVLRNEIAGRKPAAKALAIMADPVFERDDIRVKLDGSLTKTRNGANRAGFNKTQPRGQELKRSATDFRASSERLQFPRLPSAFDEAVRIAGYLPAKECKLSLGFEANLSTAKSPEMKEYRIIHFATHGILNNVHPELSGIVLSLVDQRGHDQDGFLRVNDIYNLELPAELVVLSACQTALGKEIKGEGLIGLTRGFMYAGAVRIVAALWKVNDKASAELMKRFYYEMFGPNQLPPAAALRAAQGWIRQQKRWGSAYYWAAFVLQGEWK